MPDSVCDGGLQDELPVIFLPTHCSHLDHVLVAFILFTYDIRTPLVAVGDNLHMPLLGFALTFTASSCGALAQLVTSLVASTKLINAEPG